MGGRTAELGNAEDGDHMGNIYAWIIAPTQIYPVYKLAHSMYHTLYTYFPNPLHRTHAVLGTPQYISRSKKTNPPSVGIDGSLRVEAGDSMRKIIYSIP